MKRITHMLVALIATALVFAATATAGGGNGNGNGGSPPPVAPPTTTLVVTPDAALAPVKGASIAANGGSPSGSGCGTASVIAYDGYGNRVSANYHWCWSYGAVYSNYGWGDYAACWGFCNFAGWHYNFGIYHGHRASGEFSNISLGVFHVNSTDTACVVVYGNGTATGC